MGCYDSSLLRPLLGSSSNNNNGNNANNNNETTKSNGRFNFRRKKSGYRRGLVGDVEDDEDIDLDGFDVNFRQRNSSCTKRFLNFELIMSNLRKIGLLVWKNLLLRKRHYVVTTFEILLPTLFALVLVYGRSKTGDAQGSLQSLQALLPDSTAVIFPEIGEKGMKISCGDDWSTRSACMVAYAPNTKEFEDVINKLSATVPSANIQWQGFKSEGDVDKLVNSLAFDEAARKNVTSIRAAIIFETGLSSDDISYKIRMMDNSLSFNKDVMRSTFPWIQFPGPDRSNQRRYQQAGFTAFQISLDKVLIQTLANLALLDIPQTLSVQPLPYPPYDKSMNFNELYFILLPNVIILGFIFIVPSIIRGVVNERETGIKELMKMCGIPNWMHWLAWMINSMLFLTISVTIVTVLLFSTFLKKDSGAILSKSDPTVWWTVLFLYVLSSTSFCFFVSSFFKKPTIAITVGIVLWLTTYYAPSVPLGDSNRYQSLWLSEKLGVALLPNMALYWALKVMCAFEGKAAGAQWRNLFEPLSSVDNLTLGHVVLMFLIDTVLYLLLTIYVEAVLPSEYGIRKPWYFIFQPSTWGLSARNQFTPSDTSITTDNEGKAGFEAEPEGLEIGVEIKNLRKVFGRNHIAVGGVSTKMYHGEIFALLGHNGAGKTTTMSCCIGMISSTSGTAVINGYDIKTELDLVRQHLGLCPQHNLLFDDLTVDEHLSFFGRLKGMTKQDSKHERSEMLRKLQLSDKVNTMAKALSGGQKRKLCLGIALIGQAKVVFLDEPTSGMDVEARRAIWDLLLEERDNRTIILTTHFMEEADVLGDRIGIMAHGKLQCSGTSMFLKKFYGAGYTLSLTIVNDNKRDDILHLVQNHIQSASFKVEETKPCELYIVLPTEACTTSVFPSLFKELSEHKESLEIKTIGLSLTTMDEVFVKAGESPVVAEINENAPSYEMTNIKTSNVLYNGNHDLVEKDDISERLQGLRLLKQQFVGLLVKRASYTLRRWVLVLTQLAIPVFILTIAILAGNSQLQPPSHPPPLKIGLSTYKNPVTLFTTSNDNFSKAFQRVVGLSAQPYKGPDGLIQALIHEGEIDLAVYRERHIVAAELNSTNFKAMFSTIPFHAAPLAVNLVTNTLLQTLDPSKANVRISVTNHPLEGGYDYLLQALEPDPAFSITNALMFGALAPIGLALLAASYIVSPLEERLCKGKQLQLMTGVNPIVYWGSSFVWDYVVMSVVVFIMVLCFPIFQKAHTYTSYGGFGVILAILLMYGYSAIPFSYVCSLIAGTVPGGFSLVTIIHIGSGMLLPFVVYILEATGPALVSVADKIRFFARFFPTYGASINTMRFVEIALKNSRCNVLPSNAEDLLCDPNVSLNPQYRQCCSKCETDFPNAACHKPIQYISWQYRREGELGHGNMVPGIGQELLYMFLIGIFYQVLLILIEYGFLQRLIGMVFKTKAGAFQTNDQDEDVVAETQRVENLLSDGKLQEDALVVSNFCKNYGSFAAVSNLSFGVHHGECFGLLGVNGAGKTTTFRMLTGDELRSDGNAYAMMYNLESQRKPFLANIGYCPQFDGIVGILTGREMVELFGRLRGVTDIHKQSEKWLKKVGLLDSGNVQCMKYSGGMKRRLSAAMAMIGDPQILLLDEPTSGVDPVSRREFWKIISSIKESGRAIILTSHSMDEIAACCSRLGIMVNGQLQCLGGVQHLKNKFAQGYSLSIKLKHTTGQESEDFVKLDKDILERFDPCVLKDKHQTAVQYQIHNASFPWDELFQTMEDLKSNYGNIIEEYSISETTLEEVFLSFARKQYSNRDADISMLRKIITCQLCQ